MRKKWFWWQSAFQALLGTAVLYTVRFLPLQAGQGWFFFSTTSWLGYVRCKACLVQGHMRKLLISAWTLQCTSAARGLALVPGVIKPLRQCRTDMLHSLDRCVFFVLAVQALLAATRRQPGLPLGFPTHARAVTQDTTAIIQQELLRQCCNCFCSD